MDSRRQTTQLEIPKLLTQSDLTVPQETALAAMVRYILIGALLTGGIGFAAGFFGPIIFTPEANQGPLLGIFITGPLGFVAGAIGGALYWVIKVRTKSK